MQRNENPDSSGLRLYNYKTMTAQLRHLITIEGELHSLSSDPLSYYLYDKSISIRSNCSACWSGYLANWEIIGTELYLTRINPCFTDDENKKILSMENLFPGKEKVFAEWFTGELIIQQGKCLNYIHYGYASTYETHIYYEVENGIITGSRTEDNRGKTFPPKFSKDFSWEGLFKNEEE